MANPAAAKLPNLDNTLGALFIGGVVVAILFGVTSVQAIQYFKRFPDDKPLLKGMVAFLWVLDLFHLVVIDHAFYHYAVTNYVNPVALQRFVWSLTAEVIVTNFGDSIIRAFFAYRIWTLSKKNIPLVAAIVVTICSVAINGIGYGIHSAQVPFFAKLEHDKLPKCFLYIALSSATVSDILISASLCTVLARQNIVSKRTWSLIRTIMMYSINGCILTCICALSALITFATLPGNLVFVAIYSLLPKLHLNALLATLNARHTLRNMNSDHISIPLSTVDLHTNRSTERDQSAPINIRVGTTVERFGGSQDVKEKV